jgi:hypothetical protein
MTTDPYLAPPPYTPSDPLTPATTQGPESPRRLRGGDGQVPVYSPTTANEDAVEGPPTCDDTPRSPAAAYFEERGLRINTHEDAILHQLFISPADRAEDLSSIPLCWRNRTNDLTQADMSTFANFLLPPDANTRLPPKLRAELASDEKSPASPTDTESDAERKTRMSLVVAEFNEGFFYPRGLLVELVFVPHHPPHAARGLDPICQSCVAANNSASRYAAQTYSQPVQPPMPHEMAMPPPQPPMAHGPAMFPHGFPPVPPMPHGPGSFHHGPAGFHPGFPPHAPYGRMQFGLGYLRDGIERFASGRGRSRGRGREEYFAGRGGHHSRDHGHRDIHHQRRSRSNSSSSSSSNESDHDHRHAGRQAGRGRGQGRDRGCGEARGRRHERPHRPRGRSSSTSSSSSSSSDSSIGSLSSSDVRGLGLQEVIRGIAAAKLDKEGRKFGLKMDEVGRKFGFKMDEVGKKIDAKIAVKELKTGFREMRRENGKGGRGIGKDEKRAVKSELKGLKKDLKAQMKEFKREKRSIKREKRDRRRDEKRSSREEGRRGERRSRGCEHKEQREWNTDGVARADTEGQVTGVTQPRDTKEFEKTDVKS